MLGFPLLGVPVRVHWSFLFVAVLGIGVYDGADLLAWTLAVFVAILLHESGHAFTARSFGATGIEITLFALGGLTSWHARRGTGPGRRFLVSAAGSALGIAGGLTVLGMGRLGWLDGVHGVTGTFLQSFVYVALVWGILNWVPILPLDGGHMLRSLLEMVLPLRAAAITRAVSVVVGGTLVVIAWAYGQRFLALFLVLVVAAGMRREPGTGSSPGPDPAGDETPRDVPPRTPPEFPI